MTSTDPTTNSARARINGPADLIAAVPHLLGFHPEDSLVLVGLGDGTLLVTARLDLTAAEDGDCLGDTLAAMQRGGTTKVAGIIFTTPVLGGQPSTVSATRVRDETERLGLELADVMTVAGTRWWSHLCTDPLCCPAEGNPLASEPTAFVTASVVAGTVVASSREAFAQRLAPLPGRARLQGLIEQAEQAATEAVIAGRHARHEMSVKRAIFAAARAATDGTYPSDEEAARYGVALSQLTIRDAVWLAVDDGRLAGGQLWLDLARRLPAPYDAPALFLYGWQAWRAGNGALASIAAERAIDSDPDYSAAELLLTVLARGTDPRHIPTLRPAKAGDAPATA